MPNPVLSLIPWTGGVNRRQNPTLAHWSQLVRAEDVVYGFDGTKRKRGGQSRRNRVPMPGGPLDDHFTRDPTGAWSVSGGATITALDETSWRITQTTVGSPTTLTRTAPLEFTTPLTLRARLRPKFIEDTGNYFELQVNVGEVGDQRLAVRFTPSGLRILTGTGTYSAPSSVGTWNDIELTDEGLELFDTVNFHVWRFDLTGQVLTIYFDETLIFTSNAVITNTDSTGDGTVEMVIHAVTGATITDLDWIAVTSGLQEESVVTSLFEFPRPSTRLLGTVGRMVATVNGRVYVDEGDHTFSRLIYDNTDFGETDAVTAFDFASFKGNLLIGRSGKRPLLRWIPGTAAAQLIPGDPPPPRISILRIHAGRVWGAGDPSHPSRIYWSGLFNEEVWTTEAAGDFFDSGFIDVEPEDGNIITGIGATIYGELIVYKTIGIYRIQTTGSPFDFVFTTITNSLGAVGHHAIQNVQNDQLFVSPYGVHSLRTTERFGDLETAFLSNDIRKLWNETVNPVYLERAWAVNNEPQDRYELLLLTGTERGLNTRPNRIFTLHYGVQDELHPSGRWSVKRIVGGSMTMFRDENGEIKPFIGGLDGHVNRQDERWTHDFPQYQAKPIG
jgi:hypothetical protein